MTNPFPGSPLYDICKEYNLIDMSQGWQHWNDLWRLNLRLPGITNEDWEMVKSEAAKLQALCAIRSGQINLNTIYPLFRRGLRLVKWEMKKVFLSFFK
jgi:hypothetical protein